MTTSMAIVEHMYDVKVCWHCRQDITHNPLGWWETADGDYLTCRHLPLPSDGIYEIRARSTRDGPWELNLGTIDIGSEHRARQWMTTENEHQGWERYAVIKVRDL
jgi:hypothetical protein